MEKSVKNKIVVITGGAAGLGFAMANKFLEKEAKLVIIIDINEQQGTDAVEAVTEKFGEKKAVFFKCDVTSDLEDTFEKIINEYKTVDLLINNAGICKENDIRQTVEVNTIALMEWSVKFYDYMRKDRGGNGGTIINVSSIYGFRIMPHIPSYHGSKFAVIGFSKSLGHEYNFKKTGVRVVVLCPGLTYTSITENPQSRDPESLADLLEALKDHEWQEVDAIGKGTAEIFEQADSGTVWLVEGSRSAVKI